ncbi:MAG: cupredoxin domain-containing protein [Solirubrobacterales bacterium]|nr:cupredoxin domain-containing protein [Solirubrobacterales bacterium]
MKSLLVTALAAFAGVGLFASTAAPGATTVRLKDNSFSPRSATVQRSSSVTFRWAGQSPHNVTVTKGPVKFASTTKVKGTYRRKLTRKGTYSFVCTIHPGMAGKLRVK